MTTPKQQHHRTLQILLLAVVILIHQWSYEARDQQGWIRSSFANEVRRSTTSSSSQHNSSQHRLTNHHSISSASRRRSNDTRTTPTTPRIFFHNNKTNSSSSSTILTQITDFANHLMQNGKESAKARTPPLLLKNRTLTMIVHTSGEMCNHLSVLAHARRTQRYIERKLPGLRVKWVVQHQANSKWVKGHTDIVQCFPKVRHLEFEGGDHDPSFAPIQAQQRAWLGAANATRLHNIASPQQIAYLRQLLWLQEQQQYGNDSNTTTIPLPLDHVPGTSNYSLPYLSVKDFADYEVVDDDDNLYDDIRDLLEFDTTRCCKLLPEPDETVFHFRNFVTELKKESLRERLDFVELSPTETVDALFENELENETKHHDAINQTTTTRSKTTKKVAILTRFAETAQPFVNAFEARGWKARLITGQSGVQDFCFAMHAQQELVGLHKSTYTKWSGILGQARVVRWYHVNISRSLADPVERTVRHVQGRAFWSEVYGRQEKLTEDLLRKESS